MTEEPFLKDDESSNHSSLVEQRVIETRNSIQVETERMRQSYDSPEALHPKRGRGRPAFRPFDLPSRLPLKRRSEEIANESSNDSSKAQLA